MSSHKRLKRFKRKLPDNNWNHLPERSYKFSIWATFRYEELKIIVENARRNRALEIKDEGDELFLNK